MSDEHQSATPLALPPPSEEPTDQLPTDGTQTYKFEELGPLVVNSNGTLSRIANWANMTEPERERTVRVLVKRNQIRLADQEKQSGVSGDGLTISDSREEEPGTAVSSVQEGVAGETQ